MQPSDSLDLHNLPKFIPGAPEAGNDLRGEIVRPQIARAASECEEIGGSSLQVHTMIFCKSFGLSLMSFKQCHETPVLPSYHSDSGPSEHKFIVLCEQIRT